MSLQVWLPLNGDLHNQGLSGNYQSISTEYTIDNNGKIGKCIKGTGAQLDTNIPSSVWDFTTKSISFGGWIKINKTELQTNVATSTYDSSYTKAGGCVLGRDSYGGLGLIWKTNDLYASSGTVNSVGLFVHVRNTSSSSLVTTTYTIPFDVWTHVMIIFNREAAKLALYINGALFNEKDCNMTTYGTTGNVSQGNFLLNQAGWDSGNGRPRSAPWYFNDVRIYDHALSPKEVEEIAKGLVLHYKLDNNGMGGENLYKGSYDFSGSWNNGGNWTTATEKYNGFTVKQRSAQHAGLSQNITCIQNDIFTISFWGKVDSGGVIRSIHRSNLGNVTTGLSLLGGNFSSDIYWVQTSENGAQWKRYWATVKITGSDITYLQWRIENHIDGKNLYICGLKLEKGSTATAWSPAPSDSIYPTSYKTTVYDSSGYSHNGTIVGSLAAATGSPRYDVATTFPTASDYFYRPHLVDTTAMNNEFTFACWLYRDYTDATTRTFYYGLCSIYLYTNFRPRISFDLASADLSYNSGNTCAPGSAAEIPLQTWTHLVFTFKNGIIKGYINGAHIYTDDRSANGTFIRGTRGSPDASFGYNWIGKLSDMRTYATALTVEQIKELYNTSMSIDSNGNIHARELVEL